MSGIRILIADDHPVFLNGLRMLLELKGEGIEVVATARDGREALERLRDTPVDVALLDIVMPGMDGVEVARRIREEHPGTRVLMLTTFDDRKLIGESLRGGALGYLLKDAPVEKIVQAVRTVHQGDIYISPRAAASLADPEGPERRIHEEQRLIDSLSTREQQVLYLLANGKDNLQIAEDLHLGEHTVRNYVSRIYEVIGAHNRAQAVLWARTNGLS